MRVVAIEKLETLISNVDGPMVGQPGAISCGWGSYLVDTRGWWSVLGRIGSLRVEIYAGGAIPGI
jgi:hypothetical protein